MRHDGKQICVLRARTCQHCADGLGGVSIALNNDGHSGEEDDVAAAAACSEVVQKVEGWGNSYLINSRACARQLQCEPVMTWSPPALTRLVGLWAGGL